MSKRRVFKVVNKRTQFPEILYVVREEDGNIHWFTAAEVAEFSSGEKVAIYKLAEVKTQVVVPEKFELK